MSPLNAPTLCVFLRIYSLWMSPTGTVHASMLSMPVRVRCFITLIHSVDEDLTNDSQKLEQARAAPVSGGTSAAASGSGIGVPPSRFRLFLSFFILFYYSLSFVDEFVTQPRLGSGNWDRRTGETKNNPSRDVALQKTKLLKTTSCQCARFTFQPLNEILKKKGFYHNPGWIAFFDQQFIRNNIYNQ